VTGFVQTLVNGLLLGGVYALAASGLTLVFGVMNVINVAHGAMLILAAYLTFTIWSHTGFDPILSILITTPIMFGFGWLLYRLAIRRLAGMAAAMSVLLTFAIALMIEGSLGLVYQGSFKSVTPSYFDTSIHVGPIYVATARLYACCTALVIILGLFLVLTKTWVGRAIRASAQNPDVARLVGIDVKSVAAFAFALGAATTGAGGSLISVLYPFLPASHYQWISRLLGVIVLGGMGSLPGAVIGALAIGVGETMTTAYLSPSWQTAVPYVVIFVVLLVRPQGILGSRTRQDVVTV
jgi:branched-chain amino acid transport system permease protein